MISPEDNQGSSNPEISSPLMKRNSNQISRAFPGVILKTLKIRMKRGWRGKKHLSVFLIDIPLFGLKKCEVPFSVAKFDNKAGDV